MHNSRPRTRSRSWRIFSRRDGTTIERTVAEGGRPTCPGCSGILEAQPESRLSPCLVLDARAVDLTCRSCRRFWCLVQHTPRSLRLLRMRRLAAAVGAVEVRHDTGTTAGMSVPIHTGG